MPVLQVKELSAVFDSKTRTAVRAVDRVSFTIWPGEVVGLVGESGSGKTVTALSILNLLPYKKGKIESGQILYKNVDILSLSKRKIRELRGNEIAMIFQEPLSSLNPVLNIETQVTEAIRAHSSISPREAREKTLKLLRKVGISDAEKRLKAYPHQLSGGMRQRVVIAMALACRPGLLIADEPTTSLDVTLQAQILDYLKRAVEKGRLSMLFVSHDLAVIGEMCERVMVMYAGRIFETGTTMEIFKTPLHPYTRALIKVSNSFLTSGNRLPVVAGSIPDLSDLPAGCTFHPRCPQSRRICGEALPPLKPIAGSGQKGRERQVRCWNYAKI